MLRRVRPRLTYANVMATLAFFLALGGTATAAVLITSNAQVARGTISGHNPPRGKHSNLIGGSVAGEDLSPAFRAGVSAHCPAGMQRGGNICFESALRTGSFFTAAQTCGDLGRRVPSESELREVFKHVSGEQPLQWVGQYWVDDDGTHTSAWGEQVFTYQGTIQTQNGPANDANMNYRCVATPIG